MSHRFNICELQCTLCINRQADENIGFIKMRYFLVPKVLQCIATKTTPNISYVHNSQIKATICHLYAWSMLPE